ncbi:MAG: TetR/AcrR family transcriptional regulator [Paludibacter sp.]|nr:TetR/AcrR family transcriptional regulator [Paludibacter sp.]
MNKNNSRTALTLIEVARKLFAKKGKKNVTMNDIAEESGKSRRTLYMYFKDKDEIYKAVINNELTRIIKCLREISVLNLPPDIKLMRHIISHLDAVKDAVSRNGSLRADFFMDIYEVERSRRAVDKEEHEMIRKILQEGVERKVFKRLDPNLSATIILYTIKGLEVPYIRQNINDEFQRNKIGIIDFVLTGIKRQ